MTPRAYDDAALLELVGEVMALLEIEEFRDGMVEALLRVVPCKWASLNEMAGARLVSAVVRPELAEEWFARFGELGHENPLLQHYLRTRDGRPYRFSDVTTREELEATRLFQEIYAPLGINHQIAFTLPADADRVLAVVLHREDRDFSDAERDFLGRASPYLIQAYRNALAYSARTARAITSKLAEAGLTERQAEVLRLVALGGSNRDIAAELGLSERTVQKHLELAFRKLGVTTRSAAATRVWDLAGRD